MKFFPLKLGGAFRIEIDAIEDTRGSFGRTFCVEEFRRAGIDFTLSQCSTSFNVEAGTLRGMHFQKDPYAEKKLVRCTAGAIFDVIVDLRPQSPTYLQWEALELTAANRASIFIPEGVAHGFQTLTRNCEVLYQMSAPYHSASSGGVRWDDPAFGIRWPDCNARILSPKDASYPYIR